MEMFEFAAQAGEEVAGEEGREEVKPRKSYPF